MSKTDFSLKHPFNLKYNLFLNLKNIPGWRTNRKIIVIECDDWGSIRMPSKDIYDKLLSLGLSIKQSRFNKYDTLESHEDLENLFKILQSVKDKNGHPAIMTSVTNVANPDFTKIRQSGFNEYYYEKFTDTLQLYGRTEKVFAVWKSGMDSGIFVPELHGREHITVQLWLQKLREGDQDLLTAFNHGFVSLTVPGLHKVASEFRPEFYFNESNQRPFLRDSILDGVKLFKEIFGHLPKVFVPSNGIFHPDFENEVAESGVKYLYVSHSMPYPDSSGGIKFKRYYSGQRSQTGLFYYTRNCAFEPTDEQYKNIDLTMKQIAAAFRWGKPANISSHRVNFVGGIDIGNRDKGLAELRKLLKTIVQVWPDVEFMSSADALEHMRESYF